MPAPFLAASGTQSATVTTEHVLADIAVPGEFSLQVDKNAMLSGDVLELRIYQITLASGTARLREFWQFHGVSDSWDIIAESPWIVNDLSDAQSLRFSLLQSFGTSRSFPWKILNRLGHLMVPTGTVVSDGGNSATQFKSDRAETTNDFWKDSLVRIASGALLGQVKKCTAYNGTTKILTTQAFTGTPANGVVFELIDR